MKKLLALILALLSLMSLCSCEKPIASDYVRGYKAKVDNDIPYVYTQGAYAPNSNDLDDRCYGEELTYKEFAKLFGNKVIHESEYEGKKYYYTVYFGYSNDLYYLFLTKDEKGEFVFKDGEVNWMWANMYQTEYSDGEVWYGVDDKLPLLLEQDRPEKLLGGKYPYDNDPHYKTGLDSFRNGLRAWADYEAYLYLTLLDRGVDRVKDNVKSYYRVLYWKAFDYTNDKGHEMCGACYVYEITVFDDGTGELRFVHVDETAIYKELPPNQDETVSLTKEETDSFLKVIEERNFYSLPSSHPEDSTMWLDGDMTFVFGDNGENSHLIKHRCPSERYDIYHIRKAVEELTKSKIDVKYGGVFIDYGYNNQ